MWKSSVKRVDNIQDISRNLVDVDYVIESKKDVFRKLDSFWICKACNQYVDVFQRPKFSSLNGLQCPWEHVPEELLKLNNVCK